MNEGGDLLDEHLGLPAAGGEQAILRVLIELCAQVVGAAEGSILVVDSSQSPPQELVFAMTVGDRESEVALVGQRVPLGQGLTGLAAVTHEVQTGAPLYDGVQQAERRETASGDLRSVIAAPMLVDDSLVGVITAVSFEPGKHFSDRDASLYARGAAVAGMLVEQQRRLAAAGSEGGSDAEGPSREGVRAEIIASVSRILQADVGTLREVVSLLHGLESLVRRRSQ